MTRETTGAGAGAVAGGGAGGGAVFTASCLCVQAPRIRAADRQANFKEVGNRIMLESPGSEDRRCGRRPRFRKKVAPQTTNALKGKKSHKLRSKLDQF